MGRGSEEKGSSSERIEENGTGGRTPVLGGRRLSAEGMGGEGKEASEAILISFNCLP